MKSSVFNNTQLLFFKEIMGTFPMGKTVENIKHTSKKKINGLFTFSSLYFESQKKQAFRLDLYNSFNWEGSEVQIVYNFEEK